MESALTPIRPSQSRTVRAVNSVPLSERMCSGGLCSTNKSARHWRSIDVRYGRAWERGAGLGRVPKRSLLQAPRGAVQTRGTRRGAAWKRHVRHCCVPDRRCCSCRRGLRWCAFRAQTPHWEFTADDLFRAQARAKARNRRAVECRWAPQAIADPPRRRRAPRDDRRSSHNGPTPCRNPGLYRCSTLEARARSFAIDD